MPSYLDLGVIAIVLISALLAMVRGFTREVLAIASWGAAAVAAVYFHPYRAALCETLYQQGYGSACASPRRSSFS